MKNFISIVNRDKCVVLVHVSQISHIVQYVEEKYCSIHMGNGENVSTCMDYASLISLISKAESGE